MTKILAFTLAATLLLAGCGEKRRARTAQVITARQDLCAQFCADREGVLAISRTSTSFTFWCSCNDGAFVPIPRDPGDLR